MLHNQREEVPSDLDLGELVQQLSLRDDWALLYIDLRNFRLYNQLYGRVAGERMLSALISTIEHCLGNRGLFYRLGAHEFLLLTDVHQAEPVAYSICNQWERASLSFYTRQDRQRGFLVGTDRRGIGRRCALVALNIGIVPAAAQSDRSLAHVFSNALQTNIHAQGDGRCEFRIATSNGTANGAYGTVDASHHRVLVVEPDAALAYLLQTTLEMRGYEVAVTSSGQEAFKLAVTNPPRVVILDLFTSDLPAGPFLCQELRRQPELRNTFLIVAATNSDREESLAAGADLFVPKPFELADLLGWIDRLIEESAKVVDLPEVEPRFRGFRR